MKKQLQGIALIMFGILLGFSSGGVDTILYSLGIGINIPWALICLAIGIIGLVFTFKGK